MTKQKFELVKQLLTNNHYCANSSNYSLSIESFYVRGQEHFRVTCFPSDYLVCWFSGYIEYFVHIASVASCTLYFCVRDGVAVAVFT